jgi:cation:H+ antiporter
LTLILFFIGFIIILKGADLLVSGASSIAARFGIPDIIVGLTIVSFGTSMPELSVSILASLNGHTDLAIGNILGSNIANVLLVLGVTAMITPLPVKSATVLSEIPFSLMAAILVGFLANAALFSSPTTELTLSRLDGVFLLFFLALFMGYIFKVTKNGYGTKGGAANQAPPPASLVLPIVYVLVGMVGLYVGGAWVVNGALEIASLMGLSESLVALTIVAIGTSLPELLTSAVAAYRKNTDIAIGNVVGSNIFNLLWVLGLSSVITELPFDHINNIDIVMVIFSSALLLLALEIGRKSVIDRWKGIGFVLIYINYLIYLAQRG